MKITTQISSLGFLTLALATPFSVAGEVTGTTEYQSGDTLTAQGLNNNFSAIVSEVNDNNGRLTTLEEGAVEAASIADDFASRITTLEEEAAATYPVVDDNASRVAAVEDDVSKISSEVDDQADRVIALEQGAVSVGHRAFSSNNAAADIGQCNFYTGNSGVAYFTTQGNDSTVDCDAGASVQLPHGRTLTELRCTVMDNTDLVDLDARLWRTDLTTGNTANIFATDATVDSNSVVVISSSDVVTPGSDLVDNTRYAYNIFMNFNGQGFDSIGIRARIYGCSISYE